MSGRVFVAGSANMDLVASVPRLPRPGETVLAGSLAALPGGKGANQAIAAAKAGAPVTFLGSLGQDAFAETLLACLGDAGVETAHVQRTAEATGTALICVDAHGQNQIAVFPGANASLRMSPAFHAAGAGDLLACQNECPPEIMLEYARAARQQRVSVLLNAAPAVPLPADLLDSVDLLVVNAEEAAFYFALRHPHGSAPPDVAELARSLRRHSEQAVIITLGEEGVCGVHGDRTLRMPAHRVPVVDTTGAGDCFCGYLAAGLAGGETLERSVTLANAAAALAVGRPGAAGAMPERSEVEKLLA
jgi:ribokinase